MTTPPNTSAAVLLIALIIGAAAAVEAPLIALPCLIIAGIAAYYAGRGNSAGRKAKPE